MQKTSIEYLTRTWNPIRMRCTPVSEGCQHCWHISRADRLAHNPKIDLEFRKAYAGTRAPILDRKDLEAPLRLKKPAVIGVQFMGDLFHKAIDPDYLLDIFGVMALAPQHKFIVLTKRSKEMKRFFKMQYLWALIEGCAQRIYHMRTHEDPSEWLAVHDLPNVVGMVTAENQKAADERIPDLLDTPWAMRGVSIEPMLGPVDLNGGPGGQILGLCDICGNGDPDCPGCQGQRGINAVILGGETGSGVRPMEIDWVRSVRNQCQAGGVPFFFKHWGEWAPVYAPGSALEGADLMQAIGHKKAGRVLDGREWNELPWTLRSAT